MKTGDAVYWEAVNGRREGTVEGPATIPGCYIVALPNGKRIISAAESLQPITK